MAILRRFQNIVGQKADNETEDPDVVRPAPSDKEEAAQPTNETITKEEVTPSADAQIGVQKIEAVTLAWSRKSLYLVLALYAFSPPPLSLSFFCPPFSVFSLLPFLCLFSALWQCGWRRSDHESNGVSPFPKQYLAPYTCQQYEGCLNLGLEPLRDERLRVQLALDRRQHRGQ